MAALLSVGRPFQHMKVKIPKGEYVKQVQVDDRGIHIDFAKRKKIALVFICLNDHYWPYLSQVLKDCRQQFLRQHQVDYFVWTDYNKDSKKNMLASLEKLLVEWKEATVDQKQMRMNAILSVFAQLVRLYEVFFPKQIQEAVAELQRQGMLFKRDGSKFWVESTRILTEGDIMLFYTVAENILNMSFADLDATLQGVHLIDTESVPWPSPTLMRYHLFLNQEEHLKRYDYIFYMDADMRVVGAIGDEILGEGLTAAEHPMYSLRKEYIPPYEPNKESTAYISRPGAVVVDEHGKPRFKPYYYAGGFQGGTTQSFIESMQTMKQNIDKDFNNNYIAIWNDESHWNKYLFEHQPSIVLSPAYIYPDSLIKEYYEPIWGQSYEPKIITLTKPFSLSSQGAQEINKFIQR